MYFDYVLGSDYIKLVIIFSNAYNIQVLILFINKPFD